MESAMKKIIIIMMLTILSIIGYAVPQEMRAAKQIADNFIESNINNFRISDDYQIENKGKISAYVFNLEPDGFIAVSADNDLYPIIAYSFKNKLHRSDKEENLIYQMIETDIPLRLDYYEINNEPAVINNQVWIEYLEGNIRDRDFQQWPVSGTTSTDGWIETRWNQSGVYNRFCPIDNSGQRAVVGCVATALAMIIDFHKYISDVTFTNYDDYYSGYEWPYIYIDNDHEDRDFPSFPELNVYLDDLRDHYNNGISLTDDDKSALSYACGVATAMEFDSNGSGTQVSYIPTALMNKFGFDSAAYIDSDAYNFYGRLQDNMLNMKPAELAIFQTGYTGGHAIICDGYNTDNYYHLNFGWGSSNSSSWYLLPEGMPNGYTIISGSALDIEGGDIPMESVYGYINIAGASPVGTYITLEGEMFHECFVTDDLGTFEIPAVYEGTYTATAVLEEGRFYYDSQELFLDEGNNFIQFNMGQFESITGTVSAPINPDGCQITVYQGTEVVSYGIANANGDFTIPSILPGNYFAAACLSGNYYQAMDVEITVDNQTIDFDLENYPGNVAFSYSDHPIDIWHLIPNYTMSCAIRLTADELLDLEGDAFSKVRFKAPINDDQGELYGQIWEGNNLVSEKQVFSFTAGDWMEVVLDNFAPVNTECDYYIGYKIHTLTGDLAYHDDGPRVSQKGAYMRTGGWAEVSPTLDFNFCIDAVAISQEFGTVTGNVELSAGSGNISDVSIKAGNYIIHPDSNGDYELIAKPGIYDITASLDDYESAQISSVTINNGDVIEVENLILLNNSSSDDNEIEESVVGLIGNYPNPFNSQTTISFGLSAKEAKNAKIEIFNIKGQKIRTFPNLQINKSSNQQIIWDGTDQSNKPVSSGIYFYKLNSGNNISMKKMILMN